MAKKIGTLKAKIVVITSIKVTVHISWKINLTKLLCFGESKGTTVEGSVIELEEQP